MFFPCSYFHLILLGFELIGTNIFRILSSPLLETFVGLNLGTYMVSRSKPFLCGAYLLHHEDISMCSFNVIENLFVLNKAPCNSHLSGVRSFSFLPFLPFLPDFFFFFFLPDLPFFPFLPLSRSTAWKQGELCQNEMLGQH